MAVYKAVDTFCFQLEIEGDLALQGNHVITALACTLYSSKEQPVATKPSKMHKYLNMSKRLYYS